MKRRAAILTVVTALTLSGCGFGESRLNPLNWFGSARETEALDPVEIVLRQETRPLVAQITELTIERTPGGAIVRATGLPIQQGWYDAELVNEDRDGKPIDGTLLYSFRARPPLEPTRVSTVQSRELTAAIYVSDITLSATRTIQVTAAQNSRAIRR